MKIIVPPLKSQGIKTKLVPWINSIIPIVKGRWIEPFLGTGVVAFNAGFEEAILNDSNPHIINFYKRIQSTEITPLKVREFLESEGKKLSISENNGYDHFNFIRDRFNTHFSSFDFLFLSRAGFNGMMRFNKKGEWNIPFCKKPERFSKSYITKIVNQVEKAKQVIKSDWKFYNKSFSEIIPLATKNDLIYCDPPYFGRYADYYNGWTEKDEELLYRQLKETQSKFILSTWHHNDYRANEMVKKYWNDFNIITRDHFYHSGAKIENRRSVVEAIVCNFDLAEKVNTHNYVAKGNIKQTEIFTNIEKSHNMIFQ